jgi:phosphoribosyl-ATP pyrophosphohydrolase
MTLDQMQSEYEISSTQALGWVELNEQQIRYDHFVERLFKLGAACGDLMHAAVGIAGEGGELIDAIKKHVVHNKPLNRENVVEELGDLRFYMQAMQNLLGITEQEVLQHNALKLAKRYEGLVYSDQAAQNRTDKIGTGETK